MEYLERDSDAVEENGIVYHRRKDGQLRVVLPTAYHLEALRDAHQNSGAHMGFKKTFHRLRLHYFWPKMKLDVQRYISGCAVCHQSNRAKAKAAEPMHLGELSAPWREVAMDHIGPFQLVDGKRSIIVLVDMFSKYAEAKVVKSQSATETMDFLLDVFYRHGCPSSVLADNAAGFLAAGVRDAFAALGIQNKHSTPYNPQGNGQVERLNKTIKDGLRKQLLDVSTPSVKQLKQALRAVLSAYNSAVHESTGYSPHYILYKTEPQPPLKSVLGDLAGLKTVELEVGEGRVAHNRVTLETRVNLAKSALKQDLRLEKQGKFDSKRSFDPGDRVYIYNDSPDHALGPHYEGPATVVEKLGANTYLVDYQGKRSKVNIRRLIKYYDRDRPFGVRVEGDEGTKVSPTEQPTDRKLMPSAVVHTEWITVRGEPSSVTTPTLQELTKHTDPSIRSVAEVSNTFWQRYDVERNTAARGQKEAVHDMLNACRNLKNRGQLLELITRNLQAGETVAQRQQTIAQALIDGAYLGREGM